MRTHAPLLGSITVSENPNREAILVTKPRKKTPRPIPMPEPEEPPNRTSTDFIIRIGGQTIRVDMSAEFTDITSVPKAKVIPISTGNGEPPQET